MTVNLPLAGATGDVVLDAFGEVAQPVSRRSLLVGARLVRLDAHRANPW